MRRIARLVVRRPRAVLVFWLIAFAVALLFADNARNNLHETDLQIPGTKSERAAKLTERQFGGSIAMAILLEGPPEEVERKGPELVQRLERIDGVQVLSPWAIGGARVLREPPGEALLTLQVTKPFEKISDETTPEVQKVLSDFVEPPMRAELTGLAPLVRAINEASLDSLDQGELIALPVLLVLLLFVFSSPIAALVPALAGLLVTRIGTALMGLVNTGIEVDALALNMVTMIGLALGVDYSLLIVSRFREELAAGASVAKAVEESIARAGRTVIFAGTALSVGMLGALFIAPGALLVSATMGVIVACLVAVLVALFAMPAGLALLGTNVNRWQFSLGGGENPWVRLSQRALRKPGVAAFFVLLPLLALSAPALALDTGPPHVANLPPDDASRKSYEAFEKKRGAGWSTPFEVTFRTEGPITTTKRLRILKRFQERIAQEEGVEAVLGPAALLERTAVLRQLTRQISSGGRQLNAARARTAAPASWRRPAAGRARDAVGRREAARPGPRAGGRRLRPDRERRDGGDAADEAARGRRRADERGRRADRAQRATRHAGAPSGCSTTWRSSTRTCQDESSNSDTRLIDPLDRAQSAVQSALRSLGNVCAGDRRRSRSSSARSRTSRARSPSSAR